MSGFSFGASKPAFGSTAPAFGSTATTSTPSFGFGSTATSAAPAFGSSTTSGFGTGTQSAFGGFGSTAPASSAPSFGFGSTTTSTAPTFGTAGGTSFGTAGGTTFGGFGATSTAPSFGGFGSTAATTGGSFGGFGSTTTTTSAPAFGGTSTFGFGTAAAKPAFGGFGTTTTGGLGTGLGSTFGTGSAFGATGTTQSAFGGFGAQQQQQPAQPQYSEADLIYLCVTDHAKLFGDERDAVLIKWNQTQAFWGFGKGWYSTSQQPVAFKPTNAFARLKGIVYYKMHSAKDEDGLVGLIINKPFGEVELLKMQLQETVLKAVCPGVTNPQQSNMKVCLESLKPLPENRTDAVVYFIEKTQMGTEVRVPAKKAYSVLKQPQAFQTLSTTINLVDVDYRCRLTPEDLDTMLKVPPSGLEPIMWEQAKKDNPDPQTMIPQVITGFDGLLERFKHQSVEAEQQQLRMGIIAENVEKMRERNTSLQAKLRQLEDSQKQLTHRILQLLCKQEVLRKQGQSLTPEEEEVLSSEFGRMCGILGFYPTSMRMLLEIQRLSKPGALGGINWELPRDEPITGLRPELNTLIARARMCAATGAWEKASRRVPTVSPDALVDINQVLDCLTRAISMLKNTVIEDARALNEVRSKVGLAAPRTM